jgi:hypothetical protein
MKHVYLFEAGESDWIVATTKDRARAIYFDLYGQDEPCRKLRDNQRLTIRYDEDAPPGTEAQTKTARQWARETEPGPLASTAW